jgi:hypothetical protein
MGGWARTHEVWRQEQRQLGTARCWDLPPGYRHWVLPLKAPCPSRPEGIPHGPHGNHCAGGLGKALLDQGSFMSPGSWDRIRRAHLGSGITHLFLSRRLTLPRGWESRHRGCLPEACLEGWVGQRECSINWIVDDLNQSPIDAFVTPAGLWVRECGGGWWVWLE